MVQIYRRIRPAALVCLVAACVFSANGQTKGRANAHAATPSAEVEEEASAALNAELFYELLLSEITTSGGDPGTGYNLMLDAARRSGDPQLYRRATDIALQSRSGEAALAATRAWRDAQPQSREANRYLLRILVALNRIEESAEPLRQELARSPVRDKISTIRSLPQLYGRASDKVLAATVVKRALKDDLNNPAVGPVGWTTIGRMHLAADDKAHALEAAGNALAQDPGDDGAATLALQLLESGVPEAEGLLTRYLNGTPAVEVRMAYARLLLESQRLGDGQAQLEAVSREHPDNANVWLLQAALQLQTGRLDVAEADLQRATQLLDQSPDTEQRQRARVQLYLMQSQLAEKRGDLAQAQAWLSRIDDSEDMLAVQSRRASLLARQGRLDEARALIRALPDRGPDDARIKLQAEVQLLREAGKFQQAYELQGKIVATAPQDNDLVYDQAMLAERAGHTAEMERLLRAIIARQPDYHNALNALGFSLADRGVQLNEAKSLIARALKFAPQDPFITDSLGWVEFRMGNRQQALDILERAFKSRPDAEIAAHLGEVLWSLGERDRALATWREGLRINKDNDILKATLKRLGVKP